MSIMTIFGWFLIGLFVMNILIGIILIIGILIYDSGEIFIEEMEDEYDDVI